MADHLICRESQIVVGLSEEQALQASHWTCSARQDVQGAHKVKGLIRRKHIIPLCFAHKIDLAIEYDHVHTVAWWVCDLRPWAVQDCMDSAMASGNQDLVWKLRKNYGNSKGFQQLRPADQLRANPVVWTSQGWRLVEVLCGERHEGKRGCRSYCAWGRLCCIFELLKDRGHQKKRLDLIWAKRGFHISFFRFLKIFVSIEATSENHGTEGLKLILQRDPVPPFVSFLSVAPKDLNVGLSENRVPEFWGSIKSVILVHIKVATNIGVQSPIFRHTHISKKWPPACYILLQCWYSLCWNLVLLNKVLVSFSNFIKNVFFHI